MKRKKRDRPTLDEILKKPEARAWLEHAEREMFPKMQQSAFSLTIWSGKPDAKLVLEIGAAVCFDKPLLILLQRGGKLPGNLRAVAKEIVEVGLETPLAPDDQRKIAAAIERLVRKPQ